MDKRAKKLTEIVVDYSLNINSSDVLLVRSEDTFTDFACEIGSLAGKRGASVMYDFFNINERRKLIEENNEKNLRWEAKKLCDMAEVATASVCIDPVSNPDYLLGVNPDKIANHTKLVMKPLNDRIVGNGKEFTGLKWNLVAYPCEGEARNAGMTMREYSDFIFSATNIDWKTLRASMGKIKSTFDNAKEVHIIVPGQTDIYFSLDGRGGGICDGKYNMPDGEVFYCPLEDSANGEIYFPYESMRNGQRVLGIRLKYKHGQVTDFSAKQGQKFLESMLNLNGAKRIGEFGIGCNSGISRYVKNLLFDEKLGGTIHLAIGESYSMPLDVGGGKNESDIHWDLVCDLRPTAFSKGGEIYVDGKMVQSRGMWMKDIDKYYQKNNGAPHLKRCDL